MASGRCTWGPGPGYKSPPAAGGDRDADKWTSGQEQPSAQKQVGLQVGSEGHKQGVQGGFCGQLQVRSEGQLQGSGGVGGVSMMPLSPPGISKFSIPWPYPYLDDGSGSICLECRLVSHELVYSTAQVRGRVPCRKQGGGSDMGKETWYTGYHSLGDSPREDLHNHTVTMLEQQLG